MSIATDETLSCSHFKKKKNYPFGRKSEPIIYCKDCKKVLARHELMDIRKGKRRRF